MKFSKAQIINAQKAIIEIQEQIIKANAASARTYKAELKVTVKLYGKAMDNWLSAMDMAENMSLDPSKEYDFNVESTVLESGKVKNKIIVFAKSPPSQDFKKMKKKRKKSKCKNIKLK